MSMKMLLPSCRPGAGRLAAPMLSRRSPLADLLLMLGVAAVSALGFPSSATAQDAPVPAPAPSAAITQPVDALGAQKPSRVADARSGTLLLRRGDGDMVEAPRLGADYDVTVSGPTARARVTQMFHNPASTHVEAIYVYPLPEGAAVDSLKMVIGERVVVGSIKERQAAKVIYEAAKADGKKAALVEQERPNIFTNSVANIGPGETVVVQIEYQEPVKRTGNEFSLRIPLVVAPRYNPKPLVQTVDFGGDGWGRSVDDPVPDRARIEPPLLDPRVAAPTNPVTIKVRLAAGFPLGEVKSRYHPVKTVEEGERMRVISLDAGAVAADRDFELNWSASAAKAPAVGLFREKVGDANYYLAFVTPPAIEAEASPRLSREMILVIDNSGSMSGPSMRQAKTSLLFALKRLKGDDRFNIVRFNHTMDQLFPAPVQASESNIARALTYVDGLEANGGTEMLPALEASLVDAAAADTRTLRQVVFITDGAIGNEQRLLDTIGQRRGRSRIFTVGIGSAPNSYLMRRGAELGRGTFTHIAAVGEVDERMRALFEKLESPVVTGLTATFTPGGVDATPGLLPDLYRGEPLVIAAKAAGVSGSLEINGMIGEQPWMVTLLLAQAIEGQGLSKVWARRKIADAEVAKTLRKLQPEQAEKAILALALEHHLVSRLTSLVAVDQAISREPGQPLTRADIPLNLPAGWDFEKVFGPRLTQPPREIRADRPGAGQQETRLEGQVAPTATRLAAALPAKPSAGPVTQGVATQVPLPATATDAELRLLAGLALLLAGMMFARAGRFADRS